MSNDKASNVASYRTVYVNNKMTRVAPSVAFPSVNEKKALFEEIAKILKPTSEEKEEHPTTMTTCKLTRVNQNEQDNLNQLNDLDKCLAIVHKKSIIKFEMLEKELIKGLGILRLKIKPISSAVINYKPGDYLEIFTKNSKADVDYILNRVSSNLSDSDELVKIEVVNNSANQQSDSLVCEYPLMSLRKALSYFFDISAAMTRESLQILAHQADVNDEDKRNIELIANDSTRYENWKMNLPSLAAALRMFESLKPNITLLLASLPKLSPKSFQISSLDKMNSSNNMLELALDITDDEICTKYIQDLPFEELIFGSIRNEANFALPLDKSIPLILIGEGMGICPFKGLLTQCHQELEADCNTHQIKRQIFLFYRCRAINGNYLFKKELETFAELKVVAFFNRYEEKEVESELVTNRVLLFDLIINKSAHVYISGREAFIKRIYDGLLNDVFTKSDLLNQNAANMLMNAIKAEQRIHESLVID